jgi:hypothetical protein
VTDKAKALHHYHRLERIATMNSTAYGLIAAMNTAKVERLPFVTECTITELGIDWTASIEYSASKYNGIWEIEDYSIEICPRGKLSTWVDVEYDNLGGRSQLEIENHCMKELDSCGRLDD